MLTDGNQVNPCNMMHWCSFKILPDTHLFKAGSIIYFLDFALYSETTQFIIILSIDKTSNHFFRIDYCEE